jgi:hypothetical protein
MVMESSDDGGGDRKLMSRPSPWCLGLEENIANSLVYQTRWFPLWQILLS